MPHIPRTRLLALVTATAALLAGLTGHGGGIVWYANHLYVTDTTGGIRVFDVNKLSKVDTYGSGLNTYGIDGVSGRSSACGLPYVLPQTHYYKQASPPPSGGCDNDAVDGAPTPTRSATRGSPSTRPAAARTSWSPASGTAVSRAPGSCATSSIRPAPPRIGGC
ncbi:hypothetical protein E4N62_05565 [Streptomyces sp. MNU76]|uniref:hypothetical protein n=1 Tax=Streptomyces sp. MNU76 TaxID=2560026 RepID=UPI001E50E49A|nr:hypothetical protein [Streptomyces sp. MNU76]MCC9704772.1 hypothetical protein [Streptomyces sp. MNU76]